MLGGTIQFKNFTVKLIEKSDLPRIFQHLRVAHYKDELINKYLGTREDYFKDQDLLCQWALDHGDNMSVMALDENEKVVGSVIAFGETTETNFLTLPYKTREMEILLKTFDFVTKQANIGHHYQTNHWANFVLGSTNAECRIQGLASELSRRSLDLSVQKGFPLGMVMASNLHVVKITKKLNFQQLLSVPLKDVKDEGDGSQLFPTANQNDALTVMCLKLRGERREQITLKALA